MLNPKSWLPQAQRLSEGGRGRVDHDCGSGRTLLVNHEADKYTAYCFRCADHGFEAKPQPSLAERIARRAQQKAQDAAITRAATLPSPRNYDVATWPLEASLWLYKASLGRPEIAELGAYYHAPSSRVVLPVLKDGEPIYWSARSVDGRTPKYLNAPVSRAGLLAEYGRGELLVLTEDILSAYRVGQCTESWSLIGVHASDRVLARIHRRGGPVAVWLDPDWAAPVGKRPGQVAGKRITRELLNLGIDARQIISRSDPKLLSQREILACLTSPCSDSSRTESSTTA